MMPVPITSTQEEEDWRDRVEVLTPVDHSLYGAAAKEIVGSLVESVSTISVGKGSKNATTTDSGAMASFVEVTELCGLLSTDGTHWSKRLNALQRLREVIEGLAESAPASTFQQHMECLNNALSTQFEDDRDTIVEEACSVLMSMLNGVGGQFAQELGSASVGGLLKSMENEDLDDNQDAPSTRDMCLRTCLSFCKKTVSQSLVDALLESLASIDPIIRGRCALYLTTLLEESETSALKEHATQLYTALWRIDDVDVAQRFRAVYRSHFPDPNKPAPEAKEEEVKEEAKEEEPKQEEALPETIASQNTESPSANKPEECVSAASSMSTLGDSPAAVPADSQSPTAPEPVQTTGVGIAAAMASTPEKAPGVVVSAMTPKGSKNATSITESLPVPTPLVEETRSFSASASAFSLDFDDTMPGEIDPTPLTPVRSEEPQAVVPVEVAAVPVEAAPAPVEAAAMPVVPVVTPAPDVIPQDPNLKYTVKDLELARKEVRDEMMAESNLIFSELESMSAKLKAEAEAKMGLQEVVNEYELTLQRVMDETKRKVSTDNSQVKLLEAENSRILNETKITTRNFESLLERYETKKKLLEESEQKEASIKRNLKATEEMLEAQKEQYTKLRTHAEQKLRDAGEHVTRVSAEVDKEAASLKTAQAKLKELEDGAIDKDARIAKLASENAAHETRLVAAAEKMADRDNQMNALKEKYNILEVEGADTRAKMEAARDLSHRREADLNKMAEESSQQRKEIESLYETRATNSKLMAQIQMLKDEHQILKAKIYDSQETEQQLKMRVALQSAGSGGGDSSAFLEENTKLTSRLREQERSMESLKADVQKKETENKELNNICNQLLAELEAKSK